MAALSDVQLGHINQITDTTLLGTVFEFEDLNYAASGPVLPRYSGEKVRAMLVINRSGGTLAAGKRLVWETSGEDGPGKAVSGLAGDDAECVGIVDSWINTTVADNETFLMIIDGPCKLSYDGSATISVGSTIGGTGSGNTDVYVDGTDQVIAYVGKALEAKTSGSAGDLYRARLKIFQR